MLSTLEGYDEFGSIFSKAKRRVKKSVKKVSKVAKKVPGAKTVSQITKTANPMTAYKAVKEKGLRKGLVSYAKNQQKSISKLAKNPVIKVAASIIPGGATVAEAISRADEVIATAKKVKNTALNNPVVQEALKQTMKVRTDATEKAVENIDAPIDQLIALATNDAEKEQIINTKEKFDVAMRNKLEQTVEQGIQSARGEFVPAAPVQQIRYLQPQPVKETFWTKLKNLFSGYEPINTEAYMAQITKGASRNEYKTSGGKTKLVKKGVVPVKQEVTQLTPVYSEPVYVAPRQTAPVVQEPITPVAPSFNVKKIAIVAALAGGAFLIMRNPKRGRR